jgi:DNA repair protein RecN (Recombination protein N)
MLTELRIENFAIIDRLELSFKPGLIAFTGETGAGKSIIIDAVETLLGGRTEAGMVRAGAERATVEGVFHLPAAGRAEIAAILEREDLLDDPDWVTLGREVRANGRSTARVNGRSVGAGLLRQIGEFLVDVHGQSEHLSLLRVSQHLGLLDAYAVASGGKDEAGLESLRTAYEATYKSLAAVRKELDALRRSEADAARRTDTLNYQIQEIESARLRPGEEEELRLERNRLANAEGLASLANEALAALAEGGPETLAAIDLFGQTLHALHSLLRLDPAQTSIAEQAETLAEGLSDLEAWLRNYLEGIEFNPRRLDQVEERLGLISGLKRKYGDSIPVILEFLTRAKDDLDTISHSGERIQDLTAESEALLKRLGEQGVGLSVARRAAGERLSSGIERELVDLHMAGARFQIDFQQADDPDGAPLADGRKVALGPHGLEKVEFMIAPNPGEGFKPLSKIASGGETSRLMLALKHVLAQADQVPTLIFDEIDQGIGGRVGAIVGQKLASLGHSHQVLCITHLPQLAAYGGQHFHVRKDVQDGRTATHVDALAGEARLTELAQMLGALSDGTLQSARELLSLAKKSPG